MSSNINYSVGILAGGKSSRMGKNKALLEYESNTFIGRLVKEFKGRDVIISSAGQKEYESLPVKIVKDEHKDIGPIEGIRQVLKTSKEEYVFICACDMPFVSHKIADYIAEFISSDYDCYVVMSEGQMHPLCAIYSKRILPVIEQLIDDGEYRLRSIFDNSRTKYIDLGNTLLAKREVRNVNTKDEYRELLFPIIFAVSGYKDSGKTWLITELINEFIKDGLSVGVIKHDGHDSIEEAEGTDTYKYACAGSKVNAVYSDSKCVISSSGKTDPDDLINYMKNIKEPPSVIILEGFKSSKYPKIVLSKNDEFPPVDESTVILKIPGRCDKQQVADVYAAVKKFFGL